MYLRLSVSRGRTCMSVGIMEQLGSAGEAAYRIRKRILKGNYTKVVVTQRETTN